MGLFGFFKKNNDEEISKQLENEKELLRFKKYQTSKKKQFKLFPKQIKELRMIGISTNDELKLQGIFYTLTKDRADSLVQVLKISYGYVESQISKQGDVFVICGWTPKMKMEESVLEEWVLDMCDISLIYECDFKGWATTLNPKIEFPPS